jgi:phosphomannomutase
LALIKSISGIRGTIGGAIGDNLTPQDIVACTAAFGHWTMQKTGKNTIVIGRDARISGELVSSLVCSTLRALGIHVIDLGLSTTPTVEMIVPLENAAAGIILTASHNPKQWNALKLLNAKGEFISAKDGEEVLALIDSPEILYAEVDKIGDYTQRTDAIAYHIDRIFELPLVDLAAVQARKFKVVLDSVNSTGSISMTPLLERMGCEVIQINEEPNGKFAHNPEPLPENLHELANAVTTHNADLGIAVDPDVDRLVLVNEDGSMFGEEYTLVAIADYVLKHKKGNTVSNLSSTRALRDVTEKHGGVYAAAAVGEVNVVTMMKTQNAVIGGEGNGGIIYPDLHYGRDSMVGIALFLSHLAHFGNSASFLRSKYPNYTMSKNKITLTPDIDLDMLFAGLEKKYSKQPINTIDGLKIEFDSDWVHLRRSNTEPIIRIYAESTSEVTVENLVQKIKSDVAMLLKGEAI